MLIITTIYCTEGTLDRLSTRVQEQEAELDSSAADSANACRVFLGAYQGKNRVLPMDRNE